MSLSSLLFFRKRVELDRTSRLGGTQNVVVVDSGMVKETSQTASEDCPHFWLQRFLWWKEVLFVSCQIFSMFRMFMLFASKIVSSGSLQILLRGCISIAALAVSNLPLFTSLDASRLLFAGQCYSPISLIYFCSIDLCPFFSKIRHINALWGWNTRVWPVDES